MNDKKRLYEVFIACDKTYAKSHYAAVKTTKIYCRLDCSCKKPLYENVTFYNNISTCLEHGYRECKVCKPLSHLLLGEENNASSPLCDYIYWLEQEELPPKSYKDHPLDDIKTLEEAKRIFSKKTNISLGKYIRVKRINYILKHDHFNKKKYDNIVYFSKIATPLGVMVACATSKGLCLLEFIDRKSFESEINIIKKSTSAVFIEKENRIIKETKEQLFEYFSKERKDFNVVLDMIGTDFQKKVWKELCNITYGKTRSYLDQAIKMENKNAIRAIANANGKNMIAIIIPCHRVIGKNGEMVGYGGGIERKRKLLALEGAIMDLYI